MKRTPLEHHSMSGKRHTKRSKACFACDVRDQISSYLGWSFDNCFKFVYLGMALLSTLLAFMHLPAQSSVVDERDWETTHCQWYWWTDSVAIGFLMSITVERPILHNEKESKYDDWLYETWSAPMLQPREENRTDLTCCRENASKLTFSISVFTMKRDPYDQCSWRATSLSNTPSTCSNLVPLAESL